MRRATADWFVRRAGEHDLTPVAQTSEWPSATPEAERLDSVRLTDAVVRIRRGEFGRMNSFIVVRNERLVVEEYFNGWTAAGAHPLQSVTKSVTSTRGRPGHRSRVAANRGRRDSVLSGLRPNRRVRREQGRGRRYWLTLTCATIRLHVMK